MNFHGQVKVGSVSGFSPKVVDKFVPAIPLSPVKAVIEQSSIEGFD